MDRGAKSFVRSYFFLPRYSPFRGPGVGVHRLIRGSGKLLFMLMSVCYSQFILTSLQVLSYEQREVYTICYIFAIFWPASYGIGFVQNNFLLIATWAGSCALMSIFTLLSAIKVEDINLV